MTRSEAPRDWLTDLRSPNAEGVLAELFAEHEGRLRQYVSLRLGHDLTSRFDASDVLQEAFLDARGKLADYVQEPVVSPYIWLRGVTRDRLLKLQRTHLGAKCRAATRQVQLPEASSVMLVGRLLAAGRPSEVVARSELRREVQRVLSALPQRDREVILMRHFEGLSNREVAEALELSDTAAAMRHGRALVRLKEALERHFAHRDLPSGLQVGAEES